VSLSRTLHLQPKFLGSTLRQILITKLNKEVEGTCLGEHGYVVLVVTIDEIGHGRVVDGTPLIAFPIKFKAIVCRPFRGEVLDAVVTEVARHGLSAEAGPLKLYIAVSNLPPGMTLDDSTDNLRFVSPDSRMRIAAGDSIRVRVMGHRISPNDIVRGALEKLARFLILSQFCVGTLAEDYLGPIAG
jgi:DNA-directed RNA polymerase II subunit RPB7